MISITKAEIEEDFGNDITESDIVCNISLGKKLLDSVSISTVPKEVRVPLSTSLSDDKIFIFARGTARDGSELIVGSVSIPQHIILNGGLGTYTQWITLFEH